MGKSSAMQIGVNGILSQLENMHFIPQHVTVAKLVEKLLQKKSFYVGNKEQYHSSAYWYASEGSNVLSEQKGGGDLVPMMTDLYDCPTLWEKSTIGSGDFKLTNLCLNMLSGLTFDFAKQLILGSNAGGGFASRNIYVVHNKVMVRHPNWESKGADDETKNKLIDDLVSINRMTGQFKLTPEFKEAYITWFPENDERNQKLSSSTLQHFMARNHTNLLKLAQIFSASESNEMLIELRHWTKARDVLESVNKQLPELIAMGERQQHGTVGIKHEILDVLRKYPANYKMLRDEIPFSCEKKFISESLLDMEDAGLISITMGQPPMYTLLRDPQDKL